MIATIDSWNDILWRFSAIGSLVFANGFFVAAEFSLVSIRRSRVEELVAQGIGTAKIVQGAVHDLDRYIAGTQVGITLASLGLGWIGEPALAKVIEPIFHWLPVQISQVATHGLAVTVAFIIITFLHVVLGELLPKSVALQNTEQTALLIIRPMVWAVFCLQPFIWALNGVGNVLLRLLGFQAAGEHHAVHSVDELEILVRQSHEAGLLDKLEQQMLKRTFRFSELTAKEVMVSRLDLVAFDIETPLETLLDKTAATTHRRIPIYEGSVDNVIGFLYLQDLFKYCRLTPTAAAPLNLRQVIRTPLLVPEAIHLDKLLELFRHHRKRIAMVVDEHGGTAGLVTMEDMIEEVFGELQSELNAGQVGIEFAPDGRILVRGNIHLYELEEQTGWKLSEEKAATIAGYVMLCLGRTACVGDEVTTAYGKIRVERMVRLRITQVALLPQTHSQNG